jgi:membrane protease YdiL (CAAX protease family)
MLPPRAAGYALGGIVAAVALSVVGALLASLILPHNRLLLLVLGQTGLWSGLLGAVWLVSTRFGTGNVWRDFGVRFRGADIGWGLLVSFVARFAGFILLIPLVLLDRRLIGSDVAPLRGARQDPAVLIAVVLMVVIGAPFIEELFFRGLLLRSLVPLAGTAGAIVVQGVVFGALHMRPSYGLGNVSIFVVVAAMGVIQGVVAERFRRLGPGIVAHGFFNLFALALALAVHNLG